MKKIAKLETILRDDAGMKYELSRLPLSEQTRIKRLSSMRGAGYRGKVVVPMMGQKRSLRIEVNDTDRMVSRNINSANKAKNMLYKETDIQKRASAMSAVCYNK
jgi:hypothetical protein